MARSFPAAWGDTRTQVRGALSLGSGLQMRGVPSSLHPQRTEDQTEEEGRASHAGASAAGEWLWGRPAGLGTQSGPHSEEERKGVSGRHSAWAPRLGEDTLPALPRALTRPRAGSWLVPAPSHHPER